jgi:hypothetical protein
LKISKERDGWFDNYKDIDNQLTKQNGEVNLEDANGRAVEGNCNCT